MHANEPNSEKQPRKRQTRAGIFISKQTIDTILRQKTRPADMIALLNFYHYTALWQNTNQPQATVSYVMKGLHWPPERVRVARSLLSKLGFVEDVRTVDSKTGKVTGWFVRLPYFHPVKNHPTDFPECGFYHSVENPTTNALRSVRGNALRSDNSTHTHRARRGVDVSGLNGPSEEARKIIEHYHTKLVVPKLWLPINKRTPKLKDVFNAATPDELHQMIDVAANTTRNEWPRTLSFVALYWHTRKGKHTAKRNGAPKKRPMPIGMRNKIINKLNEEKGKIMRTFPDGKFALWATERLANIQRELEEI